MYLNLEVGRARPVRRRARAPCGGVRGRRAAAHAGTVFLVPAAHAGTKKKKQKTKKQAQKTKNKHKSKKQTNISNNNCKKIK